MLDQKNLHDDCYYENENVYDEEENYFDDYPELSNDELDYISENYKRKYVQNTIKSTKPIYPANFKNLKNTTCLKSLKNTTCLKSLKNTVNKKSFIKKIVENKKRTCEWVKKEINNKINIFLDSEYPVLEAGNTKIKIEECKKETESWFHVKEKKKNNVKLEEINDKKYIITKCHFDNQCRNIKRLNDGIYINKNTDKKCKYLHSYETIENYNNRLNTDNTNTDNIDVKDVVKNIVIPILKVFSKIKNPWSIETVKKPLLKEEVIEEVIKQEDKIIFIKAPKSLEKYILNMGKRNGYNIKISLY